MNTGRTKIQIISGENEALEKGGVGIKKPFLIKCVPLVGPPSLKRCLVDFKLTHRSFFVRLVHTRL